MARYKSKRQSSSELKPLRQRLELANREQTGPLASAAAETPPAAETQVGLADLASVMNALVEGIRDPAALLSCDQTILACNGVFAGMLGHARDQLLGQPIGPFVYSEDLPALVSLLESYPDDFEPLRVRLTGSDGQSLPAELAVKTLAVNGTRILCLLATDLRHDRRTRDPFKFQAFLLDNISDAVVAADEQNRITYWNAAAERLYGYTAAEVLGRKANEIVPSEATPEERAEYVKEMRETGRLNAEVTHYDRHGNKLRIYGMNSVLRDADGKLIGYAAVSHDITELRRDEEQLREQAALLDLTQDAILVRDPQSRITFWNRGAQALYGWTREEAIGSSVQDLLRTRFPRPLAEIERAVEQEGYWEGDLVHTTRAGHPIPVHSRWSLLRDDHGHASSILQINTDITERKRAETAIRQLNADLERRVAERTADLARANKELESFSYSVSHDLRAPLASINSFSRLLFEDYAADLPPGAQRCLEFIQAHVDQMSEMVESLLNFSRLTREPLKKQEVDMAALVRDALEVLQAQFQKPDLTVEIGELLEARADPVLLKQVWMNLIGNALKFSRQVPGARIEIGCKRIDGEEHVYYVRDNGVGFDPEQAERLFGVFQRLHHEDEYEGTGIGLATVQRIIHRHGGRVWAEGEVGRGATFFFTIEENHDK